MKKNIQSKIKKMKNGEILHFPTIQTDPLEAILECHKHSGIPMEQLEYERHCFYFKAEGIKEEGWTDSRQVNYTKK